MKKTILSLCLFIFLGVSFLSAATLDEILALNYKTKGGVEKLNNLKSIHMKGKINQSGMEMPIEIWAQKPKKVRMQVAVQGVNIIMAYDGTTAWWIMPMMGINEPQEIPESQRSSVMEQSEMLEEPLLHYKELGHKLELIGEDSVEGAKVYKLKLTKKDGKIHELYLDAESGIELKQVQYIMAQDKEVRVESILGDYKQVDGMMFPGQIDNLSDGNPGPSITIESIVVNPTIEDSFFAMEKKN